MFTFSNRSDNVDSTNMFWRLKNVENFFFDMVCQSRSITCLGLISETVFGESAGECASFFTNLAEKNVVQMMDMGPK